MRWQSLRSALRRPAPAKCAWYRFARVKFAPRRVTGALSASLNSSPSTATASRINESAASASSPWPAITCAASARPFRGIRSRQVQQFPEEFFCRPFRHRGSMVGRCASGRLRCGTTAQMGHRVVCVERPRFWASARPSAPHRITPLEILHLASLQQPVDQELPMILGLIPVSTMPRCGELLSELRTAAAALMQLEQRPHAHSAPGSGDSVARRLSSAMIWASSSVRCAWIWPVTRWPTRPPMIVGSAAQPATNSGQAHHFGARGQRCAYCPPCASPTGYPRRDDCASWSGGRPSRPSRRRTARGCGASLRTHRKLRGVTPRPRAPGRTLCGEGAKWLLNCLPPPGA